MRHPPRSLQDNRLGVDGARALANALAHWPALEMLEYGRPT